MSAPPALHRRPEVDLLRTLALLGMIIYHAAYDLATYWHFEIDPFAFHWWLFARATAILFLLLVGVSAHLSALRRNFAVRWNLQRFGRVMAAAITVSIATYIADPDTYVRFGILHLIALSALLLPLTLTLRRWNMLLGIAVFALTAFAPDIHIATVDWFPPFPWMGVIFVGAGIGALVYSDPLSPRGRGGTTCRGGGWNILSFPGRHSLLIYLLHQPIIMLTFWLLLEKAG